MFAAVFEPAATDGPGILFGMVDAEAQVELAQMFVIRRSRR
jgi:hypothetical protein